MNLYYSTFHYSCHGVRILICLQNMLVYESTKIGYKDSNVDKDTYKLLILKAFHIWKHHLNFNLVTICILIRILTNILSRLVYS
jgi:hypothetical protein